ncbi:MAG: FkbM family methyltransferase [Gemmataceae bacterium]|nr:FkbM family methyltransferase [Gemmataceae bacterium]MDW8266903.1 FkbM family methyltransferase [Gemmataceae bacterium]
MGLVDLRARTAQVAAEILGSGATTIIDVGARWGMEKAWYALSPLAKLIGFEPDAEECARLNERRPSLEHYRYVPLALGHQRGKARLHLTREPACSSLYPPCPAMQRRYPALAVIEPVGTVEVDLVPLDDWATAEQVNDITFLKLDTQGSELDILRGAERVLQGCVGLEIEVEFSPIYIGQPLFADIDPFLRERGFVLWRLSNLTHYGEGSACLLPRQDSAAFENFEAKFPTGNGRLVWANALYFRDYRQVADAPDGWRRLLVQAALLAAAGDADAAARCLEACLQRPEATPQSAQALAELISDLRQPA